MSDTHICAHTGLAEWDFAWLRIMQCPHEYGNEGMLLSHSQHGRNIMNPTCRTPEWACKRCEPG